MTIYLDACCCVSKDVSRVQASFCVRSQQHGLTNLVIYTSLLLLDVLFELLQRGSIRSCAVCFEYLDIPAAGDEHAEAMQYKTK